MLEAWVDTLRILDGTLRLATPLILCAAAGLVSERSGIIDIGLEGKLLAGAFAAAAAASLTGSPWLGLAAAMGVAVHPRPSCTGSPASRSAVSRSSPGSRSTSSRPG